MPRTATQEWLDKAAIDGSLSLYISFLEHCSSSWLMFFGGSRE